MKRNMGRVDRVARLAGAAIIAVLLIFGVVKGTTAIVLAILAAVFVITTFVGFCPIYAPLGFSTKGTKKRDGATRIDA